MRPGWMTTKRSPHDASARPKSARPGVDSQPDKKSSWARFGAALALLLATALGLTAGCLDRPITPATPKTSNVFVDQVRQTKIDKIDLLFVIDNSISMADKQEILAAAVPGLLERLINPSCVNQDNPGDSQPGTGNQPCPGGYNKEFDPIDDIHIGIVTSSLGGHGGQICTPDGPNAMDYDPSEDDMGHLLATIRPNAMPALTSFNGQGFLAWDPGGKYQGGENNSDALKTAFTNQVTAAGEQGCGYEATLEAWYRFLVDPFPPAQVVVDGGVAGPARNADGTVVLDQEVLQQRANFLREDSLVAIIMLSDENDCSIVDGGIGYLTAQATLEGRQFNLPESTQACDSDPNSPCCRSCGLNEAAPPSGCGALGDDAKCQAGRQPGTDALNLRCFNQKQRFGFDLLYPIQRYVDGLTQLQVYDTHNCANGQCPLVENPLFAAGEAANSRDPSLVFLAGIVGVPWQDIATADSVTGAGLKYKTAGEMLSDGTYGIILGDPATNTPPADPLMFETPADRTTLQIAQTNPATGEPLANAATADPQANSINGHEYDNSTPDDLQYACIFPLTPKDCLTNAGACDCTEADLPKNRPLCSNGGGAGTTQYWAKAYPGLRHLHVLRDFGNNAIVASICPKVTTGSDADPNFGYNPAVSAIIDRLKEVLGGRCLPRALAVDQTTGLVPCAIVETTRQNPNIPPCNMRAGRIPVEPGSRLDQAVRKQLEDSNLCGRGTVVDCSSFELCEIEQLVDAAGDNCRTQVDASGDGYCYVDPLPPPRGQGIGEEVLVDRCPDTQKRLLRFVGNNTPITGSITFVACVGAAFSDDEGNPTDPGGM